MGCLRDEAAVRACHKAPKFCDDSDISHPGWHQNLLKGILHARSNFLNIVGRFLWMIWNAYAAGKVDKADMRTRLLLKLRGQAK